MSEQLLPISGCFPSCSFYLEKPEADVGMYAGDVRATYMAETVTILLAASCVPIALKLFSWVLIRKIDVVTLPEALRLYALWSGVRLALLAIPVLAGFFTYYIMLSSTGALCALIGLTASLFCLPGEGRCVKNCISIKKKKCNRLEDMNKSYFCSEGCVSVLWSRKTWK